MVIASSAPSSQLSEYTKMLGTLTCTFVGEWDSCPSRLAHGIFLSFFPIFANDIRVAEIIMEALSRYVEPFVEGKAIMLFFPRRNRYQFYKPASHAWIG